MIITIRDPNILSNIEPPQVVKYLQRQGWEKISDDQLVSIWKRTQDNQEKFEVLLPLQPEISGFSLRMYELLETLEIVEGRSQLNIINDLISKLTNHTLQGIITKIYPNTDQSLAGKILVLGVINNQLQPIFLELLDYRYILAIKAYQEHLPIIVQGDLIRSHENWIVTRLDQLNLMSVADDQLHSIPSKPIQ
jgi:hypothetical protein